MEIRTNADALKALLGVSSPASTQSRQLENADTATQHSSFAGDRATLSQAGAEVAQVADQTDIRTEKVASIQRAIASGAYGVPATQIADKIMDSMVSGGVLSGVPERDASGIEGSQDRQ
jgi:negative regulator of flagellin synthesis FlgM